MELTVNQALQQAVEAHKKGKLQDAEALYRAILQAQHDHPDANHNLGLLILGTGKHLDAIPLFKAALEANPRVEQFWLSYIDVLITAEQFEEVNQALTHENFSCLTTPTQQRLQNQLRQARSKKEQKGKIKPKVRQTSKGLKKKKGKKIKRSSRGLRRTAPSEIQLNDLLMHYQTGRFAEAEELAITLTQEFPKHPFAWRALGVIAQRKGELGEALMAMQRSVDLSPEDAEALSNLGAILKELGRLNEAEASLRKAVEINAAYVEARYNLGNTLKELGQLEEAEENFQKVIALKPDFVEAHSNLGVLLRELDRLPEAETSYNRALELQPDFAEVHNNLGITLKQMGRFEEAEASYRRAVELNLNFAEALYNLGNLLQESGKLHEAEASYKDAIAARPNYPQAHCNLGVVRNELRKLPEAQASFESAIALDPGYPEAHFNLGITLQALDKLDLAERSYTKAIALRPDFAEAHNNLGNTLGDLGRPEEATSAFLQAIRLKPDFSEGYANLGEALKGLRFKSSNRQLYPPLIRLLTTENIVRPADVAGSILSLLKQDPVIKDLLNKKSGPLDLERLASAIEALEQLPLLHHLMRISPLPDLQFEEVFTAIRKALLTDLNEVQGKAAIINFLTTLSLHCLTNEYIYFEDDEESQLVFGLESKIEAAVANEKQPRLEDLLCLATYRPLRRYAWCQKLQVLSRVPEIKLRHIDEPLAELEIAKHIPLLVSVSDVISQKVREQYEENPYPRWVKLDVPLKAKSIARVSEDIGLHLYDEGITDVWAPEILIAGCGTGQHSIGTAARFANCKVTAVDLSLASLAYAQRKANELAVTGVRHLQADILGLHKLEQSFHIIESGGVLHHMEDPMTGWRVLTDLLKPGGLMKIGLYSKSARRHITTAREEIAALRVGSSEAEIRRFRRLMADSGKEQYQTFTRFSDFFSLSNFRDLLFHVNEHCFTLPQIKGCLNELGLSFCGFEDSEASRQFRRLHGEGSDLYDLELWHQLEEIEPDTFAGMYQFWCQKI